MSVLFHENVTLAYFVFLGDQSSALSASAGFFVTYGCRMMVVGFFSWPRGTHLTTLQCFSCLQKTKYRKGNILCLQYHNRVLDLLTVF